MIEEPHEIKKTKSKDYDTIMAGPVKALPEGFTIYDKTTINVGSLTFKQLFEWLKTNIGIDVIMVSSKGQITIYNAHLKGNSDKPKLDMKVEHVYLDITKETLPLGRYYLVLEVTAETADYGSDFTMPPIKYCIK